MVRLPRHSPASNRKSRHSPDIEGTVYTLLLIVAAILLMAYVLSGSNSATGFLLPPSAPIIQPA